MSEHNHYLNLYQSKVNKNDLKLMFIEIAYMHNALGLIIKQLSGKINLSQNSNRNICQDQLFNQSDKESCSSKVTFQQSIHKEPKQFRQNRIAIKQEKYIDSQIQEIEQSQEKNRPADIVKISEKISSFQSKVNSRDNLFHSTKQQSKTNRPIFREGIKNNNKKEQLQGVNCQVCKKFYTAVQIQMKNPKLCTHMSRHKTTAPYTKIHNFSQAFDDF